MTTNNAAAAGHTPGPWRWNGHYVDVGTTEDNRGYIVAKGANAKANARLIAAAPELLEALEKLIQQFDDMDEHRPLHAGCVQCTEGATPDRYNTGPCPYHKARAALSKVSP